jgi:hypothetical protein
VTTVPPPERPHEPPSAANEPATLRGLLVRRLTGSTLDAAAQALLLNCLGEDVAAEGGRAPRAYLQSVTVSGFRGIGRTARLPLKPGPGIPMRSWNGPVSGRSR